MLRILCYSTNVLAALTLFGCISSKSEKFETIANQNLSGFTSSSKISVSGSSFSKAVTINGLLNSSGTNYQSLTINGPANLDTDTVNGALLVKGKSNITNTNVKGILNIFGDTVITKSEFNNVKTSARNLEIIKGKVQNIYIENVVGATVAITGNSTVYGDVVFSSPNGELLLEDVSSVNGNVYLEQNGKKEFFSLNIMQLYHSNTIKVYSYDSDLLSRK